MRNKKPTTRKLQKQLNDQSALIKSLEEQNRELSQSLKHAQALEEVYQEQLQKLGDKLLAQQHQIEHLSKQLFGSKSDRPSNEAQILMLEIMEGLGERPRDLDLDIDDQDEEEQRGQVKKKRRRKRKKPTGRAMLPEDLPRETQIIELSAEERIDPETGEELQLIGYQVSEVLVEEPASLHVLKIKRAKYARSKKAQALAEEEDSESKTGKKLPGVITAPLPSELRGPIDRCKAAVSVLATIIVLKYCYHMSLYRLQERYFRLGKVWIPRSTMCGWVTGCAQALEPIYKEMKARIIQEGLVGFDDTRMPMLQPEAKAGKSASCRLWSYCGLSQTAPYHVYDFQLTREARGPLEFLEGYRGTLVGDAYSGNKSVVTTLEDVTLAGCWDHARRYFVNASDEDAVASSKVLAWIKQLYKIEEKLESEGAADARREQTRKEEAVPVLEQIREWLEANKDRHLPKGKVSKAITYCRNQWQELCEYGKDGRLPISNCLCEQSFKAVATGRKNWLFVGSEEGGKASAIIYSIIMTCRNLNIDPQAYLEDVLKRVNEPKT